MNSVYLQITISFLMLVCLYFSLCLQKRLADPEVIVYITNRDKTALMLLIIKNISDVCAEDVSFSLDKPIYSFLSDKKELKSGPLFDGIPLLPPQGVRRIILGGGFAVIKQFGDEVINITIKYRSKRKYFIGYKHYTNIFPIETKSFQKCSRS